MAEISAVVAVCPNMYLAATPYASVQGANNHLNWGLNPMKVCLQFSLNDPLETSFEEEKRIPLGMPISIRALAYILLCVRFM